MSTIYRSICLSAIILTLSIYGCTDSDIEHGPYSVGFETYKTYDNTRPYSLGEDTISRPLLIHFWFPSKEKTTGSTIDFKHYIDLISQREDFGKVESEIDENSLSYVHAYSEFAKAQFGLDTTISAEILLDYPVFAKSGLTIQNSGSEFPLLIYAPSNSKSAVQNHMLCEYLASHGFMILSVGSAGGTSLRRGDMTESTMAQVADMEYILDYCKDSLQIQYTKLGVFGFSSGGNALVIFQMRNKNVDAVFSMDGGQEYGAYMGLYKMTDFNLKNAKVPYCSVVNNYENFSIYPVYNSICTSDKFLFQMPHLDHNGFISHWRFFESMSSDSTRSKISMSYDNMSRCALGFFNMYLKPELKIDDATLLSELDEEYIRPVSQDYTSITKLCNALLDKGLDSASELMENSRIELLEKENQVHVLGRMFIDGDVDLAIRLYIQNLENHPDSWQAHFDLGYAYKEKGETLLSKKALLRAQELNPENPDIANLLDEVENMREK